MRLLNHKDKIYIEFISKSKIVKKSLNLNYNSKNLKYVSNTLLPIFKKLLDSKQNMQILQTKRINSKISKSEIKLSEICDISIANLSKYAKPTTLNSAKFAYKKIREFFGDKKLKFCDEIEIEKFIFEIRKKLSPRSVNLILAYLSYAFSNATRLNLISKNPLKNIKKPKITRTQKTIFTIRQIYKILKNSTNELKIFLYIAFFSGARCGEILALNYEDFDIKNHTIKISKNLTRFGLLTPKNGNFREIYAPKILLNFIEKLPQKSGKIFTKDYFGMYYEFKKFLKKIKIPSFGLHTIRHTYVSLLIKNSISPLFIAKNLGHSNLTQINCVYSQMFFDDVDTKAFEKSIKNFYL